MSISRPASESRPLRYFSISALSEIRACKSVNIFFICWEGRSSSLNEPEPADKKKPASADAGKTTSGRECESTIGPPHTLFFDSYKCLLPSRVTIHRIQSRNIWQADSPVFARRLGRGTLFPRPAHAGRDSGLYFQESAAPRGLALVQDTLAAKVQ